MKLTTASAGPKLIRFRGLGAHTVRLKHSSAAGNRKRRRVTFAGIGGGGLAAKGAAEAWQAAHNEAHAARKEGAAERAKQQRQQRVDALLDRCALAAGITQPSAN
jgi:hypothetical protein